MPATLQRTLTIAALVLFAAAQASAGSYRILHSFRDNSAIPSSGLVLDPAGNAYGTTAKGGVNNAGTVYQMSPKTGFHIIYAFSGHPDGRHPQGNLVLDAAGNLYGTTINGGTFTNCDSGLGCGTVFKLTPPQNGGTWKEMVLYNFSGGSDGASPQDGVVLDATGNLYGTTAFGAQTNQACQTGCGTVFELAPSQSGWALSVLHTFSGDYFSDGGAPRGGLVFDVAGNLFGTTSVSLGTAFQMTPGLGGQWSFDTIHRFSNVEGGAPFAGLTFDEAGNLYGTMSQAGKFGLGTVFQLTLDGNVWSASVLHDFAGGSDGADPVARLVFDSEGSLYGTTSIGGGGLQGQGTVFKLTPGGGGQWTESLFRFRPGQGAAPTTPVLLFKGNVYGTASATPGVMFEITP